MDNENKTNLTEFSSIVAAFAETMSEKYSDTFDRGLVLIAVDATNPQSVQRQTAVLGDPTALTYGVMKELQDGSEFYDLLQTTLNVMRQYKSSNNGFDFDINKQG